jgi:hypothetical protein
VNLGAARIIVAGTALWMVLSRFDLPSVVAFPPEVWASVTLARKIRFGLFLPLAIERALYLVLHLTLLAAIAGIRPRVSCFVSGLLLYHFAPMESVIWTPNPYLRGFTMPALALLILAFGLSGDALTLRQRPREAIDGGEYRWPLVMIQLLICEMYLFAAYSKLFASGWRWLTSRNMRAYLLLHDQFMGFSATTTWGHRLEGYPLLCGAIGWAGILFEVAFPLVLVSRRARWLLLPAAAVFHVLNSLLFHIYFQNVWLLLIFVDWSALRRRTAAAAPEALAA